MTVWSIQIVRLAAGPTNDGSTYAALYYAGLRHMIDENLQAGVTAVLGT